MQKFVTNIPEYEILKNGFLKIKARIFKEGVYSFEGDELCIKKDFVNVFYPLKEFVCQNVIEQFSMIPIVVGHEEVNVLNSHISCGHIAGQPFFENGDILTELIINDSNTISKIISKQLVDLSLYFTANYVEISGEYESKQYNGHFESISLNHIALLPKGEGRMGVDVKVFNNKKEEIMEKDIVINKDSSAVDSLTEMLNEQKKANEEQANKIKKLEEDLNTSIENSSENVINKKIAEAQKDNDNAAIIDSYCETKVANSGLVGKKLYDASLLGYGIDTSSESLEVARFTFNSIVKTIKSKKTIKQNVAVSNSYKNDNKALSPFDDEYEYITVQNSGSKEPKNILLQELLEQEELGRAYDRMYKKYNLFKN